MDQKILEQIAQVKDVHIKDIVPNQIDGVTIDVVDGRREIYLPVGMSGEKFLTWKKHRGGIFYKDIFSWLAGDPCGKYIQATGEGVDLILRVIDDEDLSAFQLRRLVHGKVKDQYVMILKNRLESQELEEESEYIKEIDLGDPAKTEEEDPMIAEIINIPLEDEEGHSGRSVSLFD